jgi:hypothetical protein
MLNDEEPLKKCAEIHAHQHAIQLIGANKLFSEVSAIGIILAFLA